MGLVGGGNQWALVSELNADSASIVLTVDGSGSEEGYLFFAAGENANVSFNGMINRLQSAGNSESPALSVSELIDPRTGAGNQFDALYAWLDEVDAERMPGAAFCCSDSLEGEKAKLVGAFLDNGELLSPFVSVGARPYWIVVQAKDGDLSLIPSRLLEIGARRSKAPH